MTRPVTAAQNEAVYHAIIGHAILRGADNWRVKAIADLPSESDRNFVEALLVNAAIRITESEEEMSKKTPAESIGQEFIQAIDEVIKEVDKTKGKGGYHGLQ